MSYITAKYGGPLPNASTMSNSVVQAVSLWNGTHRLDPCTKNYVRLVVLVVQTSSNVLHVNLLGQGLQWRQKHSFALVYFRQKHPER